MSGAVTAAAITAAAAVATTVYTSNKQDKAQAEARKQAEEASRVAQETALRQEKQAQDTMQRQEKQAAVEANRVNRNNRPNAQGIVDAAAQVNQGGAGSTMLTGAAGVDPGQLNLGKNTLLGG